MISSTVHKELSDHSWERVQDTLVCVCVCVCVFANEVQCVAAL